jgi:hypothetical protein
MTLRIDIVPSAMMLILSIVLATACRLTDEQYRSLDRWLTCDECVDGEREAVRDIGNHAISRLNAALIGPSAQKSAVMDAKFHESFPLARVPGITEQQYVQTLHANYVAMYQKRAAVSLGDIGGSGARQALDDAIAQATSRHYRPDVLRTIKDVRSRFASTRFQGTVKPGRVSFGGVVTLIAPSSAHFTGDERAFITDSVFPSGQVPFLRLADTIALSALGNLGPHTIEITNVGSTTNSEVASVIVTSLLDSNDTAMVACADSDMPCVVAHAPQIGHPFPETMFLALWRTPPRADSSDYFRIQPAVALPVTARINWSGPANLDLLWRRCSPFNAVGNTSGATAANPEQTSVTIPAGQCWILLVRMAPGAVGPAFARLQVTSP